MPTYSPTPDMIDERCLEVQATWDEDTRRSRQTGIPKKDRSLGWTPPIIGVADIQAAVESHITENRSN